MAIDLLLWSSIPALAAGGIPARGSRRAEASARRLIAQRAAIAAVAARQEGAAPQGARSLRD